MPCAVPPHFPQFSFIRAFSYLVDCCYQIEMRVQTEEWRLFVPGIRMYKGKKTLFYNGEILRDAHRHPVVHNEEERYSWEAIIVLPGVEIIPAFTFYDCRNVNKVIMSDTVRRMEESAFDACRSLEFVKLSRNLEFIGKLAFCVCKSLTSILDKLMIKFVKSRI